jgi:L-ascorbate metabolism protein UlaG (beta-lactamase superfamily)
MKLKIIIGIIAGIAFIQFINTNTPVASNANHDHTLPGKIEDSPQYKDGKFNDMGNAMDMSFIDYVSTTWDFLFTRNHRTPDTELPVKQVDLSHFNNQGGDQLNVTWPGHSSLMLNIDGYKILVDPVFEKRISVFGPTRFNGDVPLDIRQIPQIDAVIISHDHYDHLNKFTVQGLIEKSKKFIVPLAVGAQLTGWGVPRDKIVELDWWQEYRLDQNLMVVATPAQHFSGRGISDRNKTLWASWVIKTQSLECGAYGKSWPKVHMFPEQTVQAHLDLKGNVLHPIHWATFNLALHPWYEPMVRLTAAANLKNIKTATPIVGETTVYGMSIPAVRWWKKPMELSIGVINTAVIDGDI